jgi:hypothetical protein
MIARRVTGLVLLSFVGLACGPGEIPDDGPVCTEPSDVACAAEIAEALSLVEGSVSPQQITNERDGDGIKSVVDARAGGLTADPRQPYLYARFRGGGLEKVELDDEQALSSMDWDIAFHRYVVRLNGGSSGPSCVAAARLKGEDYDALTSAPAGLDLRLDEQMTAACGFRADSEAQDPANEQDFGAALRGWYLYVGCLETTYDPFVIRLADGRLLKLVVTHYYADDAQAECNETGSTSHEGAGVLQVRWAFLEDA